MKAFSQVRSNAPQTQAQYAISEIKEKKIMTNETTTRLIYYIGAIVIAAGIISVVSSRVGSITVSYGIDSKTLADQLRTEITIINDPQIIPYVSNNYSFYVKNTR